MQTILIIILALLLLTAATTALLCYRKLTAARIAEARMQSEVEAGHTALNRLQNERTQLAEQLRSLQTECTKYQTQVAESAARREESAKAHEEARRKLEETFKALSADALKSSSEQFLQLAKQKLAGQSEQSTAELEKRKTAIENLIKPIHETLKTYQNSISEIEKSRKESYGSLRQQLTDFAKDQKFLRNETQNLVNALRRPEVRGRWGEMQLRRVAELAGMIKHCDFFEQQHTATSNNANLAIRPDMTVKLPNNRTIVIDAKAPLDAYISAIEADDVADQKQHLNHHVRQIEARINELAKKSYAAQFDHSPDFVVLFIPGEAFLQAAAQQKPDLIETALEKGIVIATPSTLISLLRVIALGWREEQMTENAERIAQAGRELHKRLAVAFEHLDKLGKSLQSTVDRFNKTVGSFNTKVLPQARRFEELGAASSQKQLPVETTTIATTPRTVPQLSQSTPPTNPV